MASQLQLCRDLFQAVLRSQQSCKTPSAFNTVLLHACQCLMLEAVQVQQEAAVYNAKTCLEAVLQLLSRVSYLGAIEAFFTADDLLIHYQRHVDAVAAVTRTLYQQRQKKPFASTTHTAAAAVGPNSSSSGDPSCTSRLAVPEQQLHVVKTFRNYAAQVCPRLVNSCSSQTVQQLFEVVKQGLIIIYGHSFLFGQEWQKEVSAMLGRAEQLKVLLAHQQAHHLSLLAALLQHMYHQEVQEFDVPQGLPGLNSSASGRQQQLQVLFHPWCSNRPAAHSAGAQSTAQHQMQQTGLETTDELADQEDEFYIPVAPLAGASATSTPRSSPTAALTGGPALPFDLSPDSNTAVDMSDDSLARMPSSGCSSLLEYVQVCQHGYSSADGTETCGSPRHRAGHCDGRSSASGSLSQLRRITEEQLQNMAGPEAAAVLAAALGVSLQGSREACRCSLCRADGSSTSCSCGHECRLQSGNIAVTGRPGVADATASHTSANAALDGLAARSSSVGGSKLGGQKGGDTDIACRKVSELVVSSSGGSRGASPLSSSANLSSSPSSSRDSSPSLMSRWQQQHNSSSPLSTADSSVADGIPPQTRTSKIRQRTSSASNSSNKHAVHTLRLHQTRLPAGCCKSIGAVLYMSPQIQRLELVDVGIDDQAVMQLVDALRVNSSVVLLDLSYNDVEDIGARALGKLLRQRSSCSGRLRALCLQQNGIGDDGAIALAHGLAGNTQLHRLWLQHNAVGQPGAMALATAMQHNTACTDLKLLKGNNCIPKDIGQIAERLAWHNCGVRDRIKELLRHMLKPDED